MVPTGSFSAAFWSTCMAAGPASAETVSLLLVSS